MSALVTEEEIQLVKSYIMLPMILSAFERDIKKIEETMKTPDPYTEAIKLAMDKATKVLTEVRRSMFKTGLKVFETVKNDNGVKAKYMFRGYTGEMVLLNDFLKAECMMRMKTYMGVDTSRYTDCSVTGR